MKEKNNNAESEKQKNSEKTQKTPAPTDAQQYELFGGWPVTCSPLSVNGLLWPNI